MLQSRLEVVFTMYLLAGAETLPKDAAQSHSAPLGHKEANRFLTTKHFSTQVFSTFNSANTTHTNRLQVQKQPSGWQRAARQMAAPHCLVDMLHLPHRSSRSLL